MGRKNSNVPVDFLTLGASPVRAGEVTVCTKLARPLRASLTNLSKLSMPLFATDCAEALTETTTIRVTNKPVASARGVEKSLALKIASEWFGIGLFGSCRDQNFSLATTRHGTNQTRFFHFFKHACGAVVADFQVALHQ